MKESEKVDVVRLQLEEWRRKYDDISNSYDKVRSRSVTLLTIQLGLFGYFISQLDNLIKPELYGKIFFVFGCALGLYASFLTLRNYRAIGDWLSPMYDLEIEKMNNSENLSDATKVIVDDYKISYESNMSIHHLAARRLNNSLFISIASVIILMVLNFAE